MDYMDFVQGFVMNLQPSEAEAGIDIRVPPTADPISLEKRIAEEWAPTSRNMTFEFKLKVPVVDKFGKPILTATDDSNPWWVLLEKAVHNAGGEVGKPEINLGTTDARYFRQQGLPAIGFSPITNTPLLLHDHNERGTGLSTPLTTSSMRQMKSAEDLDEYLKHFRADNIVNDAEFIRKRMVPNAATWTILGQGKSIAKVTPDMLLLTLQ